jgi:hypothetical protein
MTTEFTGRLKAWMTFKATYPELIQWMQAHPEEPLAAQMQHELSRRGTLRPKTFRAAREQVNAAVPR